MSVNAVSSLNSKVELKKTQNLAQKNAASSTVFGKLKTETKSWLNDTDKICTDGVDDGKLSFAEGTKSFAKGLFGIVKSAVKHPVATGLTIAASAAATALTGGAILPFVVSASAILGIGQIGLGIYKASTAKADGDAKGAFETMGNGTFAFAASLLGAKPALKSAQNAGVYGVNMTKNPFKNILNCFKVLPDALTVSKANTITNLTGIIRPDSTILRNSYDGFSKPVDTEVYRFNPNGTTEEVLANNPNVSFDTETGKYYVQTSWGEKAYVDPGKEYLIANYGEGHYNAIAGDIFQETYVDKTALQTQGVKNYINPETLEYGKPTIVTKQAPIRFALAKAGTKYQSLEGVHTLEPDSVIMIDSKGNPYQNTLTKLFERNEISGFKSPDELYALYSEAQK